MSARLSLTNLPDHRLTSITTSLLKCLTGLLRVRYVTYTNGRLHLRLDRFHLKVCMLSTLKSSLKVLLISLILILSLVEVSNAHHHPGYYHDRRVMTHNPRWMTSLIDLVHVSELSIPGTHDTMARYGGPNGECQTLTLPDQLESGIRVLDIRCRHIGNAFAIHHGVFYQHANFDDVLKMTVDFLRKSR